MPGCAHEPFPHASPTETRISHIVYSDASSQGFELLKRGGAKGTPHGLAALTHVGPEPHRGSRPTFANAGRPGQRACPGLPAFVEPRVSEFLT